MVNSLLKALDKSNSVSLPDFGGFMKMGSSYMFNEFLKFNDGKFSKFLQENEKLSEQEAKSKIEGFITEIKTALDKQGSFTLDEIGILTLIDGKIKLDKPSTIEVKKEEKPAPKKSEPKPVITPPKEEKLPAKESKKEKVDIAKVKETKQISSNLSVDFTVKEAQEKIKSLKDKQEIIDFTKGDTRKTIVESLNQRLKSLNKIDTTELEILETTKTKSKAKEEEKNIPIKEGSEKEVKKQVANESDILNTVVEKELADRPKPEKEKEKVSVAKKETKKENITPPVIQKEIEKKETKKTPSEEEDLVALTEGAVKIEKEAKGRKRNKIIFWIALICILSGGSIVGYLKQDLIMGWFDSSGQLAQNETPAHEKDSEIENNETREDANTIEEVVEPIKEEVTENVIVEDNNQPLDAEEEEEEEVIEEEIIEEEPEIEPKEEIRVESVNMGSYYAVVGSFSKEKNAANLVKSLKESGFNNAKIFQNGNLQSVSLGVYATSSEAKEALAQSGKDGWVKKPK